MNPIIRFVHKGDVASLVSGSMVPSGVPWLKPGRSSPANWHVQQIKKHSQRHKERLLSPGYRQTFHNE